jgi:hypothetical protein
MDDPQFISEWFNTTIDYKAPEIVTITGADLAPTQGNQPIQIHFHSQVGFGIKQDGLPLEVRYGKLKPNYLPLKGIDCKIETNQVKLTCTLGPGAGMNHYWRASFGGTDEPIFSNLLSTTIRYAAPVLERFETASIVGYNTDPTQQFNTSGGQNITIHGKNFGPHQSIYDYNFSAFATWPADNFLQIKDDPNLQFLRVFQVPEEDCSHSVEHFALECKMPVGIGANVKWIVTIDGQQSVQPTTGYGPPEIEYIVLSSDKDGTDVISEGKSITGMDTNGNQWLRIRGRNFGSDIRYFEDFEFGCSVPDGTAYTLTEAGNDCHMTAKHTEILCKSNSGIGTNHRIVAHIGGQETPAEAIDDGPRLNYATPMLKYVQKPICSILGADAPVGASDDYCALGKGGTTKGGYEFDIIGENFGPPGSFVVDFNGLEYGFGQRLLTPKPAFIENSKVYQRVSLVVPMGSGINLPVQLMQQKPGTPSNCDQHSNIIDYSYSEPIVSSFVFSMPVNKQNVTLVALTILGPETRPADQQFIGDSTDVINSGSFGIWPSFIQYEDGKQKKLVDNTLETTYLNKKKEKMTCN